MSGLRVYADTSVFGGCLDDEFSEASKSFFKLVQEGRFRLVVSDTTLAELQQAPPEVRRILLDLSPERIEHVIVDHDVESLRDAYLEAGVVGSSSLRDAEHIASATVAEADMVVSWNFKHIVHYDKISGYQGVNLIRGYGAIRIFSPWEVI